LLLKDEIYVIIGAEIEVYQQIDPGILEFVYQEAMEIELAARAISIKTQKTWMFFQKHSIEET